MKILIISQYFYPENFRINDLAEELYKQKHQVTVLTGLPNYPKGKIYKGFNIFSLGYQTRSKYKIFRVPLIPRYSSKSWQLFINYFSFAFFSSIIAPFFLREKYDAIFVYEPSPFTVGIPAVIFKKLRKIPIFFWVQDLWPESIEAVNITRSKIIINSVGILVKWIYQNCDVVLIQSRGFTKPAILRGAIKDKIKYLPNWAEDFFVPLKPSKKFKNQFPKKGFNVVFAGNLGEAQSLETIINAAQIIKDQQINWIIIGEGRKKDWMVNKVKSMKLNNKFKFLGSKPVIQMPNYFAAADVLLVTLKNDPIFSYTIPGKIQSYLACGKPIIAAINGEGAKVINKSMSGQAVNAEDYSNLARVIVKFSKMSKSELSIRGKKAVEYYNNNFNRKSLIRKIEGIIRNQLKSKLQK